MNYSLNRLQFETYLEKSGAQIMDEITFNIDIL